MVSMYVIKSLSNYAISIVLKSSDIVRSVGRHGDRLPGQFNYIYSFYELQTACQLA